MTSETLLNVVWAVWVWTALTAACVLLLRRRPAVLRRQLCRLGLIGVPVAMLGAGLWHASHPGAGLWVRRIAAASIRAPSGPAPSVGLPAGEAVSWPPAAADDLPTPGAAALEADHLAAPPSAPGEPEALPHATAAETPQPRPALVTAGGTDPPRAGEPWQWPASLAGAVSLVMLLALAARQLRLTVWRRTWRPAAPAWQSLTARLARRIGMRRPVRAFIAERLRHPAAAGIIRPAILLPKHYPRPMGLGLRGVLAHELAHLRGRDPLWNLIGRAVLALGWWCPLTWWLHRRMRIESELTADDHALAAGAAPASFAETLARLAESGSPRPAAVMSGMACHLKRRIKMMLNERVPHSPASPLPWRLGIAAGACVLVAALISTPLVGVVRADDPKPAAGKDTPAAGVISKPPSSGGRRVAGRGAATPKRTRTTAKEIVSLRISVKDGGVVIETADGQRIEAKEVTLSTHGAGKMSFGVEKRGDRVLISASPARARYPTGADFSRTGRSAARRPRRAMVFELKHAQARDVVPKLGILIGRGAGGDVTMLEEGAKRIFVASANVEDLDAIASLIKKLDVPKAVSTRPAGPPRIVKIYPLKHASAGEVVDVLTGLFRDRKGLRLDTLSGSNAVAIQATEADMKQIEELLLRMETASEAIVAAKKAAPKKVPQPPAEVRDARLRVLLGEAERRVIDLEAEMKLAELNLERVVRAYENKAATVEEVKTAEIKLRAARKKLDSATKELKELQQLAGKPARAAKGAGTARKSR